MSGERSRKQAKKMDTTTSWLSRNRLSAVHWRSQFVSVISFYFDGGSHRYCRNYITYKELSHSYTIIVFSFGTFGAGIGQLLIEILGK